MASKSQTYFNNISPTKKNTISLVVNACKSKGITNAIFQAGLCGIVSKESDFVPKGEGSYATTSAARIRTIFGKRFKSYTDAQIDVIKKDQKQFFSIVYGDNYGNGAPPTQDGWTFRGRGFNQLTFRGNYQNIGKGLNQDLNAKPELMENLDIAAKALVQYYVNSFSSMKASLFSQYGITKGNSSIDTMNSIKDIAAAVRILYQSTAGPGKTEGGKPVALHYEEGIYTGGDGDLVFPKDTLGGFTKARNRAPLFYKLITGGSLPPNPNIPPTPVAPPTTDGIQTATASSSNTTPPSDEPVAQESSKGNNDATNEDNSQKVDEVTPGLSNIFPPTIKVEPIKIKHKGESKEFLKEWSSDIGTRPFIWYNSYQIDDKDIEYFALYHDGLLPTMTLSFKDSMNLMKDKGFPLDDTKIKIFLSSRTKNIRHILLEFKIANFSVNGDIYTIKGVLNVNGLHLRKFKSYSKKTSFFALQDICKEVGLGFNSNITDSKDQMTWINTGQKVYDFMDEILSYSYISDEGFSYGYVDFFYNFNYVDIEKELSRDASEDNGIDSSGFGKDVTGDDKKIKKISLSNDRSLQESDSYVSEYKILNNSTSVSLEKGYLNVSKYYDSFKKEYLIFDVDSITSEGSKSIIMKGSPQDENFYKENVNTTYVGKLDPDNAHINYNYSYVHNSQNIDDLQKIGIKLTLPNPNYNLYRFQKIVVLITNKGRTPSANIKNDRISGDWFITEIKFIYSGGSYNQEISLIKRELEVSKEEFDEEQILAEEAADGAIPPNNQVEKTTNPTDLTNTDAPPLVQPVTSTASTPQPTVVAPKPTEPLKAGKLLVKTKSGLKYIGSSGQGVAGHRLIKIIEDLGAYLTSQGFKTKLGNNGICRDLAASLKGGGARAAGSLHGSGLAIDILFGPAYKKDYYVYNKQGVKLNWLGIGDNKNLAADPQLTKAIWTWVKSQGDITWGAEWGGSDPANGVVKGHGVVEYHHFEIKKSLIPNYWSPFNSELSNLGFNAKDLITTTELGKLYTKLDSTA